MTRPADDTRWTDEEAAKAVDEAGGWKLTGDYVGLVAVGRALLTLRQERDEAVGIGPGSNDGSPTHCSCRRRMVWQYPVNVDAGELGSPAWICPDCVTRRMRDAESEAAAARARIEECETAMRAVLERVQGPGNSGKSAAILLAALSSPPPGTPQLPPVTSESRAPSAGHDRPYGPYGGTPQAEQT